MYNLSQVIDLDHQSFFIQWMVLVQLKTSPSGVLAGLRHAGRAVTKTVGDTFLKTDTFLSSPSYALKKDTLLILNSTVKSSRPLNFWTNVLTCLPKRERVVKFWLDWKCGLWNSHGKKNPKGTLQANLGEPYDWFDVWLFDVGL